MEKLKSELKKATENLKKAAKEYTTLKHDLKQAEARLYLKLRREAQKKMTEKEIEAETRLELADLYEQVAAASIKYDVARYEFDAIKSLVALEAASGRSD